MAELVTGLYEGTKASAAPCNGNLYVAVERERPQRVKETDPGTIVAHAAGIMKPNFTPTPTSPTGGSPGKSAGDYYVRLTFYSSVHLVESDPGPVIEVTGVTAGDKIVIDNTNYAGNEPTENGVDTIFAYVTLVNPKVEAASERGTYYRETEIALATYAAGTSIELEASDATVSGNDPLSFRNDPPPDSYLVRFWRNRLWYAGQDTFTVNVTGIASATITTDDGKFTEGHVGRTFYLEGDNIEQEIVRVTDSNTAILNEAYAGAASTGTGVVVGQGSAVYYSEVEEGFGLPGVPLPENVPRTNVALFDRDDGHNINGLIGTNQLLYAFKDNKWGRITGVGQNFTKVEDIGARCRGDTNLATDDADRVYFWADDGLRRTTGVTSELVSDDIKDMFDVQIETDADLQINKAQLDRAPLGYHPYYKWIFGVVATGSNTNNDLIILLDLRTNRWFTFKIFEGSPTATVDITRILSVVENGEWEVYLAGKITISGTDYVGRLFKMETGYVDTDPAGTNRDILYEFDSQDVEHPDRLIIAAREVNIEQARQSAATTSVTVTMIRETDDTENEALTKTVTVPLTKGHGSRALPRVTGRTLRLRFSGTVSSADEEYQFRSISIPMYPVGSRR